MSGIKEFIKEYPIADIKPHPKNPRIHPNSAIEKLQRSIQEFGFVNPILISKDGILLAGHARVKASKEEAHESVPALILDLEGEKADAYLIADNKLQEETEWDLPILKELMGELNIGEFDLSITGFDLPEIDELLNDFDSSETDNVAEEDNFNAEEALDEIEEPVSRKGDIFLLGRHRLMCGDSTNLEDIERLMDGEKADMVFTDPPYNVNYSNIDRPKPGKRDLGKIQNDVMDDNSFKEFLQKVGVSIEKATQENAAIYVWYASRESLNFYSMFEKTDIEVNQQIIWKKPMLLGRSRYQWAHEPCLFAVKGSPYHTEDRTKTTVWDFGGYDKSKNVHPTQKPLFLANEAMENSTRKDDLVLDLFGGSGSTLIAAEQVERKAFLMELDEKFCDVIIKRWEEYTGEKAVKLNAEKTEVNS